VASAEGMAALRRVLTAFSWHCERIGYCQSLNYIAALLLLVLPSEERAFWVLATLLENVLYRDLHSEVRDMLQPPPAVESHLSHAIFHVRGAATCWVPTQPSVGCLGPHTHSLTTSARLMRRRQDLLGCHVETRVLKALVDKRMPELAAHLRTVDFDMSMVATEWLLTAFVKSVPSETAARILDATLCEGSKVLCRVVLALFKVSARQIADARLKLLTRVLHVGSTASCASYTEHVRAHQVLSAG
jgi:hypothetical protein